MQKGQSRCIERYYYKRFGGDTIMVDEYIGQEVMKNVNEKNILKTYYSEQWKE